jgi:2,4-dienoyl-CoA reductase-like NADH-dependent reductase (Old Yellow Enzyme family)
METISGEWHTNAAQAKGFQRCPRWTDPEEIKATKKIAAAIKEKERKAFLDKVRACGSSH